MNYWQRDPLMATGVILILLALVLLGVALLAA